MANTLKIKRGTAATIPQGQLAEPLFTTDTYDLYIGKGSGGNQRIQNYIASGTSSQFLKGDGSLDSTTYQTALTFSSPLVNTSGTISIPAATSSVNGYLTSTDWTTFNSKEPAITAGTTSQYYRGDKTFQTLDTSVVPENGPIYFTEPRVRATVLTGLNLSGGGTIAATDSILTAFGKVQNQISALVGGATYQGTWNANTNTPTLASGTGTKGYYYVVSVAGSTNLDGITDWKIGDWAIFNGTTWDKVDNTDAVSSVNGFTGAVNLALDNISDVSAASPTNGQLLRFNGTSSLWENWTPTYISSAITSLNGLTDATQTFAVGTTGTDFNISSATGVHTFNIPSASAANRGLVTIGTQTFAGDKSFLNDLTIDAAGDGYIKLWNAYSGTPSNPGIEVKNYNGDTTFSHNSNGGGTVITGSFTIDKSDVANNLQLRLKQGSRQYWDILTSENEALYFKPQKSTLNEFPSFVIQDKDGNDKFSLNTNTSAAIFSGTLTASNFTGSSSGTNTGDQTNISGNAATATKLETARTLTIGATGKTFDGSANVSWTLGEIGAAAALSGTSGRIAYWNSGTTIAADDSLLFSPTSTLAVNNVITAAAGGASAFNLISTINAAANNDILYGVRISPTFNNGAFTGVTQRALGVFGDVYINGTITSGAWNGSVIGSSYGGAGTVNGIMKANGSGTVSAAVAGTDYVIPSALSSYLPLTGGTLTGALSGTSATFSSSVTATQGNFNQTASSGFAVTIKNRNATQQYGMVVDTSAVDGKEFGIYDITNSAYRFTISSTGAATFSSSLFAGNVSATRSTIGTIDMGFSGSGYPGIGYNIDYTATNGTYKYKVTDTSWMLELGNSNTFKLRYAASGTAGNNISYTDFLTISSTGAATFSSTITAKAGSIISSASNSDWALTVQNSGTTNAHGLYVQIGATSTGVPFLVQKGSTDYFTIANTGAATFSSSVGVGGTNTDSLLTINGTAGTSHERFREGSTTVGFVGGANGIITGHNGKLALRAESGLILSGTGNSPDVIIASGGNVGISTTSPDVALHIVKAPNTNNDAVYNLILQDPTAFSSRIGAGVSFGGYYDSTNTTFTFANIKGFKENTTSGDYAGALAFSTRTNGGNPTERMRITSGGNVLIGTTTGDGYKLQIVGASQAAATFGQTYAGVAAYSQWVNSSGAFVMGLDGAAGATERMRITSGGRVGIGQTAPGVALSVAGQTESWQLALTNVTGTAGAVIGSPSADVLAFGNWAGTERMRITSGGAVQATNNLTANSPNDGNTGEGIIAGTSFKIDATGTGQKAKMYVVSKDLSDTYGSGLQIQFANQADDKGFGFNLNTTGGYETYVKNSGGSFIRTKFITQGGLSRFSNNGTYTTATNQHEFNNNNTSNFVTGFYHRNTTPFGLQVEYTAADPNGTGSQFLNCQSTGGLKAEIRSNGGLANYSANDVNLSDIRTKKDIAPLDSYWNKFKELDFVKFKYKDQSHDDYNIGLIAQQVEQIAPEFIDADGWGKTPEDGVPLKTIYTTDLYHAAMAVLKEALIRIEKLENK